MERYKECDIKYFQLLDVQRRGKVQWRRNNMSLARMRRSSYGPADYVMDSAPFFEDELKEEQERQLEIVAEGKEIGINWSCMGNGP